MKSLEERKRSFAKAITYRIYQSFLISPLILFILTGNARLSLSFGFIEFLIKIPAYYLFERIWTYVKRGYRMRE